MKLDTLLPTKPLRALNVDGNTELIHVKLVVGGMLKLMVPHGGVVVAGTIPARLL